MKKQLIRKTWPKIRTVEIKGQTFYRVDARRKGTAGKQETFKSKKEAEERANEIEGHFSLNGTEGLAFPAELRGAALLAAKMLQPYGKGILQAAEFYKAHLDAEKTRKASALVSVLADTWYQEKKSGRMKRLRPETLRGIYAASEMLKTVFKGKNILDVTTSEIRLYLDGLKVGMRRKFNINSRFSQFFNWCVAGGYVFANPCEKIDIHVDGKDVAIFTPAQAVKLMSVCKEKHKDLVLYHAIGLFAGLRPTECRFLKWEQIHLEEETLTVLAGTSKTKETRNVPIEPNLLSWINEYAPEKRVGYVTSQTNLVKRLKAFHVDLGYKGGGKNEDASEWPQDVMRHSYGSYWLAKFKNRAELAEHMGNSLQIIKKHYKKVVGKKACEDFWKITPTFDGQLGIAYRSLPDEKRLSDEEIWKARGKRIARALAEPPELDRKKIIDIPLPQS